MIAPSLRRLPARVWSALARLAEAVFDDGASAPADTARADDLGRWDDGAFVLDVGEDQVVLRTTADGAFLLRAFEASDNRLVLVKLSREELTALARAGLRVAEGRGAGAGGTDAH